MTKITIEVKTKSGKPIDHASVIVKFVQGLRSAAKFGKKDPDRVGTPADQRRRHRKDPVSPTRHDSRAQIIAKNYQTFGQNFDIDEEQKTLQITLNPPQAQYSAH